MICVARYVAEKLLHLSVNQTGGGENNEIPLKRLRICVSDNCDFNWIMKQYYILRERTQERASVEAWNKCVNNQLGSRTVCLHFQN